MAPTLLPGYVGVGATRRLARSEVCARADKLFSLVTPQQ
jgi:hypothetical protein